MTAIGLKLLAVLSPIIVAWAWHLLGPAEQRHKERRRRRELNSPAGTED